MHATNCNLTMAFYSRHPFALLSFVSLFFLLLITCSCSRHLQPHNVSHTLVLDSGWSSAGATWYGPPEGFGSDGGACGYQGAVGQPPLSSMVAAGSQALFNGGKGCGGCYEVKCIGNKACSGSPVTVVITDQSPEYGNDAVHFDLSGAAFGALAAVSGKADELRNAGVLKLQYRRVGCNYGGVNIHFRIDAGSNPYYFATVIQYANGDGDLAQVDLQEGPNRGITWLPMQQSWGATWKLNSGSPLRAPFSIRLKTLKSGKTLVANNVIPVGWQRGQTYQAVVNFHA